MCTAVPEWMDTNIDRAKEAVEKLTDQTVLADVAKHAKESDVRMAAAEMRIRLLTHAG